MKSYDVLRFETLDSTNDYVKTRIGALLDHTLVVAGFQTRGRGRRDRVWESSAALNFLGTFYKTALSATNTRSMMTGVVAVVRALDDLGLKPCIKPPNDVYAEGRKIAGILAEVIHREKKHVITGVGVNVNEPKTAPAVSIRDITHEEHDLEAFTALLKYSMESAEAEKDESIFKDYIDHIPFGRITAHGEDVQGTLEAIDSAFNCTVGGKRVPCDSLTFEYK